MYFGKSGGFVPSDVGVRFIDTGALRCGTTLSVGRLTLASGRITDSSGTLSFGDNHLSTTGTMACAAPTASTHAANKRYVDAVAQGLHVKPAVRVATTAGLALEADVESGKVVDGVTLATGDRVLVKNQATESENGIYVVRDSGAPTRAADVDADADVRGGAFTFVQEGDVHANKGFVLTTDGPVTVGSSPLRFTQFSGVGSVTLSNLGLDATTAELNLLAGARAGTIVHHRAVIYGPAGEVNASTLQLAGSAVTATAAELNVLDGGTSAPGTALDPADRVVVNDDGTMKQVALTDVETYLESALDTLSNVTTVGALRDGSIAPGFGDVKIDSSVLECGTATVGGALMLDSGSITDASGAISFDDENLSTAGTMTAAGFTSTSDARLKENVTEMAGAVAKVQRLRGVDFTWAASGKADAGVIAQEVEAVAPHWVTEDAEGIKSVDYGKLSALLIQAVKEQQDTIHQLQKHVEALRAVGGVER